MTMDSVIADIKAERQRQIDVEGYEPEHDDAHQLEELVLAAACYLERAYVVVDGPMRRPPTGWPWERSAWKPKNDARRNLVRAAALVVAEIERLDRVRHGDAAKMQETGR